MAILEVFPTIIDLLRDTRTKMAIEVDTFFGRLIIYRLIDHYSFLNNKSLAMFLRLAKLSRMCIASFVANSEGIIRLL